MTFHRWRAGALSALALLGAAFVALPAGQAQAASCGQQQYTVKRGDVLWRIAWLHHTNIWALTRENHLANPNLIYVNQCLTTGAVTSSAPAPTDTDAYQPAQPVTHAAVQVQHAASNQQISNQQYAGSGDIGSILTQAARDQGVSPALVKAIAYVESGWNPGALSYAGAMGLMQLMPTTAAMLNAQGHTNYNVWSAYGSAELGAMFLRGLLNEEHGCLTCAISAYNEGPANFAHYGFRNWNSYVAPVLADMRRFG